MSRNMVVTATLSLFVIIYAFISAAHEVHSQVAAKTEENGIHLSKRLHRLLSAEMNRLQNGMTGLTIAIPAGQWDDIEETARKMKNGYIMKKKLSKEEMEKFHHSLPRDYREMDHEFQKAAGQLTDAAKEHDEELVHVYFCRLNESCVQCHSLYATKRFPGFRKHSTKE